SQDPKIDRLREKRLSPTFKRALLGFGIAIGGDHYHRHIRAGRLSKREKFKPPHARHVDVRQDQNEREVFRLGNSVQRSSCVKRELHAEPASSKIAAELLPEQNFNVRLIVDDQDQQSHAFAFNCPSEAADRGRTTRNSVNSPGFVSTSIVPACCFTMMS